jgi:hypothetical protein
MIWLLIGAVLGCLHFLLFMRKSLPQGHSPKELALAGFLGALIYGSLLVLGARMFFELGPMWLKPDRDAKPNKADLVVH